MATATGGSDPMNAVSVVQSAGQEQSLAPEKPAVIWKRRLIIISFCIVALCFGLPHWVWTTSIHRSELPLDAMNRWAEGKTCRLHYPLYIELVAESLDEQVKVNLATRVEDLLGALSDFRLYDFRMTVGSHNDHLSSPIERDSVLVITLSEDTSLHQPQASLRAWVPVLDIQYGPSQASEVELLAAFVSHEIRTAFEDEHESLSYLLSGTPFATGNETELRPESRAGLDARTTRAFKYASTYHLTFSLFSSSTLPSTWAIEEALEQYITPLLGPFSTISQFTIDTQVQLHASFSPSIVGPQYDGASAQWKLQKTDLSGFINAAEWPLSPSIGSGPTINFVLYVPTNEQSPMVIAETGGSSWLIPQWGGVRILNPHGKHSDSLTVEDLRPVMLTFADQLSSLLGLPQAPPSLSLRISSLTRERATFLILSASSTLGALARLTLKLTSIAIPSSVARSVEETTNRLEAACLDLREGRFGSALENARIAEAEAEQAFFEPSMVGQVYFPDEHKVAVYVPLLGPMAVPLVMACVKELKTLFARKQKTA